MKYTRQVEEITKYFKSHEKEEKGFKIGIEFEHYVIDLDTFRTISYYGENGVEESLRELTEIGWEASYEGEYILGLVKDKKTISLEPGSQLELSIDANISIATIEREYEEFISEINPILKKKNQGLLTVGYHPVTKIDEITLDRKSVV